MTDKSRVFLSYSRRDMQVVNALAKDLEETGVDVWIDRHDIAVGERWSTAIQKALEDSYAMVLVISPDSMTSSNVEDEFTYFLDAKKPIVPIMIRPARLHFQLHRLQWIDFTKGATEKAFQDLVRALHSVGVEFRREDLEADRSSYVGQLLDGLESEKHRVERRRRGITALSALAGVALVLFAVLFLLTSVLGDNDPTPKATKAFINGVVDAPSDVVVAIYEEPSRDSRIVTTLRNGNPVFISKRTPNERFLFVQFGLDLGWVLARDILITDGALDEIAIAVSPTPLPSATFTPIVTATPTVTPSPTPEQVTGNAGGCVLTALADTSPKTTHLEPSVLGFSEFDTVYPSESFIATARSGFSWYYIGIGWVQPDTGLIVNDQSTCEALPEAPDLRPVRLRRYIKDLALVQQLIQTDLLTVRPIATEGLTAPALPAAVAWNSYEKLIDPLAELLNLDRVLLTALITDEANLRGDDQADNLMPIRFEADVFRRYLTKEQQVDFDIHFQIDATDPTLHSFRLSKSDPFVDYHTSTELEWQAFVLAKTFNEEAALRAIRYGFSGILGDNHYLAGYVTPKLMYEAYMRSPVNRLLGKLDYLKSQPGLLEMLRLQNWEQVALTFDGTGQDRVGLQVSAAVQAYYQALLPLLAP